jgi:hypothetical protein
MVRIKNKLRKLLLLREFLKKEINSTVKKGDIRLLMRGFFSESHVIYNLRKNDINQYLSDYDRLKTSLINDKYSIILNDKGSVGSVL